MLKNMRSSATALALACASAGVHAGDFFRDGSIDGEVRLYRFDRNYDNQATKDQFANSLAGLLTVKSGTVNGFSAVATGFSAHSFGTQQHDTSRIDASLMGQKNVVDGFTQAYAQYANAFLTIRMGDQYLSTPWMGQSDTRVIPASYQAGLLNFRPAKGWDVYVIRVLRWKSRTSDGYEDDNLYYPSTYHNDTMYGNNGSLPATAHEQNGTTAIGSTYAAGPIKAQAWYYNFEHFAHTGYLEGTYTLPKMGGVTPFISAQVVRQTGGNENVLIDTQTKLLGVAGQRVDSRAWGIDTGVNVGHAKFDFSYNKLQSDRNAVGAGAIISPYTSNYSSDPLFTSSMLRGLVEQGPGHAWKARAMYSLFQDAVQLTASYARYDTILRGVDHEVYADVTWKLDRWVKGLQVRDRWEHPVGGKNNLNPGNMPWSSNRLMLSYKF